MKNKNRKQKQEEYNNKYSDIPLNYEERLEWMYDKYKLNCNKESIILNRRNELLNSLYYTTIKIVLYEIPEGAKRPRTRLINKHNFINEALHNSQFIHIYSPNAMDDRIYMKRLIDEEIVSLSNIIYTPCIVKYDAYLPTPNAFNVIDKFLAECGIIRPICKPDFDNIAKKYSDMYNSNIWIDDSQVIDGEVHKYYSILPRVEITLSYLNMLYNKYQYNSISNKIQDQDILYYKGDK